MDIFSNFALNSLLRTGVTVVAQVIATKLALDAAQTDSLATWLAAGATQIVAFLPVIYNQMTRPSQSAMSVAVQADKVMAGEKKDAVVQTPADVPNIVIKASNQNIGHS